MRKETDYSNLVTTDENKSAGAAVSEISQMLDNEIESLLNSGVTIVGFSHSVSHDPTTGTWVGTAIIVHFSEVEY